MSERLNDPDSLESRICAIMTDKLVEFEKVNRHLDHSVFKFKTACLILEDALMAGITALEEAHRPSLLSAMIAQFEAVLQKAIEYSAGETSNLMRYKLFVRRQTVRSSREGQGEEYPHQDLDWWIVGSYNWHNDRVDLWNFSQRFSAEIDAETLARWKLDAALHDDTVYISKLTTAVKNLRVELLQLLEGKWKSERTNVISQLLHRPNWPNSPEKLPALEEEPEDTDELSVETLELVLWRCFIPSSRVQGSKD